MLQDRKAPKRATSDWISKGYRDFEKSPIIFLDVAVTAWSRTRFGQFVTLRHRPDRIIVGEIRGGEAFDLLQLLNTGHSGTLSTVHANSAAQGISRFTTCVLQRGVGMPYRAIKTNIADSLNIIIQIER